MEHTPRPWEVTVGPTEDDWAVCKEGAGDIIVEVGPHRDRAYLFAAAPELLEALKGMLDISHRITGCGVPECSVCQDNDEKLGAAHAVVAKVKGE